MKRFVQGQERSQGTLFPACLDEYVSDDNPVRVAVFSRRGKRPRVRRRRPAPWGW